MTTGRTWVRDGTIKYHPALEPLLEPTENFSPHPENNNNGDIDEIDTSIEINGMYRPIMVQDSTGYILAGNHTWMALAGRGAQRVPVIRLDVDDDAALRILLGDNYIAAKAIRDNAATVKLLARLSATDRGLLGTGYTADDLTVIRHLAEMPLTYEHAQWPTLTFTVHPKVRRAFRDLTREADTDPEKFELLLRMAGWDGR
jgi:ParB-like chromosome segregation protein Spo0J